MRYLWMGLVAALLSAGVACSSSGSDDPPGAGGTSQGTHCTGGDTYEKDIEKPGAGQQLKFAITDAVPAPPNIARNTWVVKVTDMNGAPVDGATLLMKTWMPAHKNGDVVQDNVTPLGGGEYKIEPVDFNMGGLWQITLHATSGSV